MRIVEPNTISDQPVEEVSSCFNYPSQLAIEKPVEW